MASSALNVPLFPKPRRVQGQSQKKENKKRNDNAQENSAFITPGELRSRSRRLIPEVVTRLADHIMSDIEMDPPTPASSYNSYRERISRPVTPISLPAEPTTDCGKRRAAMTRLKNQETMIEGYWKFLTTLQGRER
ncbi:hypothetical protein TNCV_4524251 [Trichonephila clavipes]|nr:hypothetical protein TNCV_4524251 [Trichonephila clavipes]